MTDPVAPGALTPVSPDTAEVAPQLAGLPAVMAGLNWAYERAASEIPGLGSAAGLAAAYLARSGSPEAAIDSLIKWQTRYAAAAGFVTNLGGLVTLPVSLPMNLASALVIQLRLVEAIAILRGYELADERVKILSFVCLTGSAGSRLLRELGVSAGTRLTTSVLTRVSATLLARAGTGGVLNLAKIVPLVGGVVGGGVDAAITRSIGGVAKRAFPPVS